MTFTCRLKEKLFFNEQMPLIDCITCPFEDCLYQGSVARLGLGYRKALEKRKKELERRPKDTS